MKQVDEILKRISVLFYAFVAIFIVGTVYGFVIGLIEGLKTTEAMRKAGEMAIAHNSIFVPIAQFVISVITTVFSVWSMVLFVRLLISIGRSIARKNIFDPRTIKLINRYAIVYAIMMGVSILGTVAGLSNTTDLLPEFYLYASFLTEASSIVMLMMFGQVIRIGCVLKQEQDLTI